MATDIGSIGLIYPWESEPTSCRLRTAVQGKHEFIRFGKGGEGSTHVSEFFMQFKVDTTCHWYRVSHPVLMQRCWMNDAAGELGCRWICSKKSRHGVDSMSWSRVHDFKFIWWVVSIGCLTSLSKIHRAKSHSLLICEHTRDLPPRSAFALIRWA